MKYICLLFLIVYMLIPSILAQSPAYPTEYPLDRTTPPPYIPDHTRYIRVQEGYLNEEKDTITEEYLYWEFDLSKNLILWEDRLQHFYEKVEYDSLNRPVLKDGFYDESSSNGTSRYYYPTPNTSLSYPANVNAIIAIGSEYTYDKAGRLIRTLIHDTLRSYEPELNLGVDDTSSTVTRYEYLRDTDKLTKVQTFSLPDYLTLSEFEYLYDPYERLVRSTSTYYESKADNLIRTQHIRVYDYYYDSQDESGLRKTTFINIGLLTYVTYWEYDFGANYIRIKQHSPTSKYSFFDRKWIFEEKKLIRREDFNEEGVLVSWMDYEYVSWK